MTNRGTPALAAALICFVIFFSNVTAGAFGMGVFFGDVAEMLLLVAATVFFVIGILAREESAKNGKN